jgi:hypothetical protein
VTTLRWLPSVLLLLPWLIGPLAPSQEARIRDLAGPSGFRLLDWETTHLGERAARLWAGLTQDGGAHPLEDDRQTLVAYFHAPRANR